MEAPISAAVKSDALAFVLVLVLEKWRRWMAVLEGGADSKAPIPDVGSNRQTASSQTLGRDELPTPQSLRRGRVFWCPTSRRAIA
jgi:hypothetical protein